MEKPKDEAEAFEMIQRLSGNWHQVHTGVAVYAVGVGGNDDEKLMFSFTDTAKVKFAGLTDEDIHSCKYPKLYFSVKKFLKIINMHLFLSLPRYFKTSLRKSPWIRQVRMEYKVLVGNLWREWKVISLPSWVFQCIDSVEKSPRP